MAATLEIKVVPKSGKQALKLEKTGILKCYLKSPPEDGKANKELLQFLSKLTKTPQSSIAIIKGELSRLKVLLFHDVLDKNELLKKLQIEKQSSLI